MAEDTNETAPVRRVMWGRRFLAATVVVPPHVAELLNTDAMAVLAVIRDEARATGRCTLPVARIAERANIGRAKTRAAIRLAESLGLNRHRARAWPGTCNHQPGRHVPLLNARAFLTPSQHRHDEGNPDSHARDD
jgi:hypothetical protein